MAQLHKGSNVRLLVCLSLLLAGCLRISDYPAYSFHQKITIIEGFYKGCTGKIGFDAGVKANRVNLSVIFCKFPDETVSLSDLWINKSSIRALVEKGD